MCIFVIELKAKIMKEVRTDFLFADESFLTGMASVLDIGGSSTRFNTSDTASEADAKALNNDWAMIGNDIKNAVSSFELNSKK